MYENLNRINKDESWLDEQIKKFNLTKENVLVATINEKGDFFCQEKENKNK